MTGKCFRQMKHIRDHLWHVLRFFLLIELPLPRLMKSKDILPQYLFITSVRLGAIDIKYVFSIKCFGRVMTMRINRGIGVVLICTSYLFMWNELIFYASMNSFVITPPFDIVVLHMLKIRIHFFIVVASVIYHFSDVAAPVAEGVFSPGHGKIFYDELSCIGTEQTIDDCQSSGFKDCFHSEDAGVICDSSRYICYIGTAYPSEAPEYLPVFSGVRVTRSLFLYVCFVDRCLSFCTFSFDHSVVCSSSIYGFWLPLWYIQTLRIMTRD